MQSVVRSTKRLTGPWGYSTNNSKTSHCYEEKRRGRTLAASINSALFLRPFKEERPRSYPSVIVASARKQKTCEAYQFDPLSIRCEISPFSPALDFLCLARKKILHNESMSSRTVQGDQKDGVLIKITLLTDQLH